MASHRDADGPAWPDLTGVGIYPVTDKLDGYDGKAVREIRRAVEHAPGAEGALKVRRIQKITDSSHQLRWQSQVECLSKRFSHPDYLEPEWRSMAKANISTNRAAEKLVDRDQVSDYLHSIASSECEGVWSVRVFHGAKSAEAARLISEVGFSSSVQGTKGWIGEGPYGSTMPTYALRYCWMTEFWNVPGAVGYLVAARACFSQVYPVTQADNIEGLTQPGLKGKPVGGWAAPGAKGSDAHFACVRSYPPHGGEKTRTYHACLPGERPQGTELVVSEEAQFKPEYIVEVQVSHDQEQLCIAQLAAEADDADIRERCGSEPSPPMGSSSTTETVAGTAGLPPASSGNAVPNAIHAEGAIWAEAESSGRSGLLHTLPGASEPRGSGSCSARSTQNVEPASSDRAGISDDRADSSDAPAASASVPLSGLEAKVIAALQRCGRIDTLRLAKECGLQVQKDVNPTATAMLKKGLIQRFGDSRKEWDLP